MTHPIYTQQALSRYTLPRLKRITADLGATPTGDKRAADTWINAIITHQSAQLQKVDEQTAAQAELEHHITTQAQAIAPEELRTVEISFYDHEIYCGTQLIATITYNNDLTQPWVVLVEDVEKFRANTWAKCYRYISWHYQDGTLNAPLPFGEAELVTEHKELPPQKPELPATISNEIMAQIFNECEKFGFEILDDGIYRNDEKLGEVGCSNGKWWFIRAENETQQRIFCDSALDAVWWLSMVDVSLASESADEYLQYRPLEQMTGDELQRLLEPEAVAA